jgi:hypothetical protein
VKKKTAKCIATIVLLAILFRFFLIAPSGGGRGVESPNKRFLAQVSDLYRKKFWGGKYNYYEFELKTADGDVIDHVVMDEPPQGMTSWRYEGEILWSSNSASVTYTFKGGRLTLDTNHRGDLNR